MTKKEQVVAEIYKIRESIKRIEELSDDVPCVGVINAEVDGAVLFEMFSIPGKNGFDDQSLERLGILIDNAFVKGMNQDMLQILGDFCANISTLHMGLCIFSDHYRKGMIRAEIIDKELKPGSDGTIIPGVEPPIGN